MKNSLKMLGTAIVVTVLNIIIFSPGLMGVRIGENAFQTAFGVTVLLASALALLYGVHGLYFKPVIVTSIKQLKTHEDYVEALHRHREIRVLKDDITFALVQEDRLKKKKERLFIVLNERFEKSEMTYQKFSSVIKEVENLFYINIRNIVNKVSVFDESEYKSVVEKNTARFSSEILKEKEEIYNEYISFVKNAININEEILLDLDKLLLEISKLNESDIEDIDNMPCIQEINTLIKQTKYYKQ